jgi:hypothetical protein
MASKSPVAAGEEQKAGLRRLAVSRDRGEADRARALLLTLSGWTSPRIAEAFAKGTNLTRCGASAAGAPAAARIAASTGS